MKTNFSIIQLRDPALAEADQILQSCQHYGFCTAGCPTYVLLRDELDAPRGRIDLIKAMLEKGGAPDKSTVEHLDKCLSCGSCMTTCAVKVDYANLIDHARDHIERHYCRPFQERAMRAVLAYTLARPRIFRATVRAAAAFRPLGRILPRRWAPLFALAPDQLPAHHPLGTFHPSDGEARYRVLLLAGCAQQVLEPEINAATIRMLNRVGCDVFVAAEAGCCGSLSLHMGRQDEARAWAQKNIDAWLAVGQDTELDAIVVNASGCGSTVKEYGHLFQADEKYAARARQVADLAVDVSEWLDRIGLDGLTRREDSYAVVYHDPCSMRNVQKVTSAPRNLLRAAGYEVADVPEAHFCCGSAGTYNMLQPDIARDLGRRKAGHLESTQAALAATGNIGCLTQIRLYTDMPIVHTVQLLDWAYGGPMPSRLEGRSIPVLTPRQATVEESALDTNAPSPSPANDGTSIW